MKHTRTHAPLSHKTVKPTSYRNIEKMHSDLQFFWTLRTSYLLYINLSYTLPIHLSGRSEMLSETSFNDAFG